MSTKIRVNLYLKIPESKTLKEFYQKAVDREIKFVFYLEIANIYVAKYATALDKREKFQGSLWISYIYITSS
jgi:hypothetical protein